MWTRLLLCVPQIVVDASTLVAQMPSSIEGFFFISDSNGASRIHTQFLQHYGLSKEYGPVLVQLDLSSPDMPFSLV